MKAALTFKLAHQDLSTYNAVQKLLYAGVILCGVIIVLSGIAIWKPVQFQELTWLFGGYDAARYVHFIAMAAIVGFLIVHIALALIVPKSLRRWWWGVAMKQRKKIPGVDPKLLIKDAGKLMPDPMRRNFLRGAASLGALTFLTGCDILDGNSAENVLRKVSEFNDGVQAAIFSPNKLAPTYPESAITRPFPFNAYYSLDEAPEVDPATYQLEVAGLVDNKKAWTLASSTRCRRSRRSPATSASKAGARSAPGRACNSRNS